MSRAEQVNTLTVCGLACFNLRDLHIRLYVVSFALFLDKTKPSIAVKRLGFFVFCKKSQKNEQTFIEFKAIVTAMAKKKTKIRRQKN